MLVCYSLADELAFCDVAAVNYATVYEQVFLGHKELRMTMRYSHLSPEHLAGAVTALDGVFAREVEAENRAREANVGCLFLKGE